MVVGIAAAAAVCRADVQQPVLRRPAPRQRIERNHPAVVVGKRVRHAEQLTRRPAVVCRRLRIPGRPLEQHFVVRVTVARRREVGRRHHVRGIDPRVELAEARPAGLREVRMERKALEPLLGVAGLNRRAPLRVVDIEVRRHALAVVADRVEHSGHRVDEQASRVRLIEDEVHPRRLPVGIRNRRELGELDGDDAVGRNRRRERVVAAARARTAPRVHGRGTPAPPGRPGAP